MVSVARWAAVLVLAVASALVATGSPAHAHTRAAAASDYESRITAVPPVDGIAWRMYAGGDLVEISVTADVEVVVAGYEGEPYLRVTPDGAYVNRNSPATYLNAERYGDVALPPRADANAAVEWRQVTTQPSYAWHDHRVHWMAPSPPAAVEAAPGAAQLVQRWTLDMTVDGEEQALRGELWWVPSGAALPWFALSMALTAPAALGVVRHRRRLSGGGGLEPTSLHHVTRDHVRPAALVVAAVGIVNLIHFVDELAAWPAPTLDIAFGVLHTALFVGAGLVGAGIAWRGTQGPFLSLGIASGALLFHQGLLQWRLLAASQLPTVWPAPLLRLVVAASLAQAVWVALVLTSGLRASEARGVGEDVPSRPAPAPQPVTAGPPSTRLPPFH